MTLLYLSWVEIPVTDLERAVAFYRTVFDLEPISLFEEPPAQIALLHPSDKSMRTPGVSLICSPDSMPTGDGVRLNFHVGTHAALAEHLARVQALGGLIEDAGVDTGDGVRYVTIRDGEGNRLALSSYEPLGAGDG